MSGRESVGSPSVAHRSMGVGMVPTRMVLTLDHERWARFFAAEAEWIASSLAHLSPTIEHVGSTAVPGLLAKPVVDIGVALVSADDFPEAVAPLEALGYRHRGEHGEDPLRRYFVLETDRRRVAQLHLWSGDATAWREAVGFRDLLRERPDLREAYAAEKRRVAADVGWDKRAYSVAKGPFVRESIRRWLG